MERLRLAAPTFRAYERILARRSRGLPERGRDGLPLPPAHLQVLVSGTASPRFEEKGAQAAASIREILRRTGGDIGECRAVLDFGVGCGRIARHWAAIEGPEWHGCDYNELLVRWCQENLPFLRTVRNELEPPLPYADETFDLVYAYSVFTHLTEELHHRWMHELRRILAPGGRIIFSTHGEATREQMEPAVAERFDRGGLAVRFANARLEPLLRVPAGGVGPQRARAGPRGAGSRPRRCPRPRDSRSVDGPQAAGRRSVTEG